MAYIILALPVMILFCSLAVDVGQAQMAKTEMYRAADAAARYAATGISDSTYQAKAIAAASDNTVTGQSLVLQAADIDVGVWSTSTHAFTVTSVSPNAVRVTARRAAVRGTAINTLWAGVLGRKSIDLTATSIAMYTSGVNTTTSVAGKCDPWLAGMPNGTSANFTSQGWYDSAPNNSPAQVSGLTLKAGAVVNFTFNGTVSYYPGTNPFNCDGDTAWCDGNYYAAQNGNAEHGIANVTAPLCSVIGVFLDDTQPDSTAAPASLDFSTASSRDFATLSPLLKQPFFIGDGLRADGVTQQNFVVPSGATRLYIGVMDFQQWSDNAGTMSTTVTKPPIINTVK